MFTEMVRYNLHTKVCMFTIEELASNWSKVLQRLHEHNLTLSADKTFICPKSVNIVG